MKKLLALCLVLALLPIEFVFAADGKQETTAEYLVRTVSEPTVSSIGGEWSIIGLARSESAVPKGYFDGYYERVCAYVKEKKGVLHTRKNTEYARVTLSLRAIGKNPESVAGYNLVKPLYDVEKTASQGLNGVIWALIALDCGSYGNDTVREEYLSRLLRAEKKSGGFSLGSEEEADADITAMALTALSRYREREDVAAAVDRALSALSSMQTERGTFSAYGTESSESVAQVVVALCSLGISPTDKRFEKNGKSLLDVLLQFRNENGSFRHTDTENLMATEQAFYALCAVKRFEEGKAPLFDMRKGSESGKINPDVHVPTILHAQKSFSDVAAYKNEILSLSARGIVNGTGDGLFSPLRTVTRAEFCAINVRALGLSKQSEKSFSDVPRGAWYEPSVRTAVRYGIVGGVSSDRFAPDGTITLEQACAMLSRSAALCGEKNNISDAAAEKILARFSDGEKTAGWAKKEVAYCIEKGIFTRKGTLSPQKAVTRGELCAAVYNLLKGEELL